MSPVRCALLVAATRDHWVALTVNVNATDLDRGECRCDYSNSGIHGISRFSPPLPSSPPLLPTTRHAPLSSILPSDNNSPTLGIEATSRATGHVLGSPKVTGWPERIFISCIVSSILPRKGLIRYVYCYLFIFFFFNKTLRSKIKMHWMMTNMNYLLFLSLFFSFSTKQYVYKIR